MKNEYKDTGIPGQKAKDQTSLIGQRFGRLTVIKWSGADKHSQSLWLCKCDCGTEKEVKRNGLLRKDKKATKSCGCLHLENIKSGTNKKHGKCKTRLYSIWGGMKQRCSNPNQEMYIHYGGRGIKVCDEWLNFENFYNWAISNGYKKELTINRIDNNDNYYPSNCNWATMKEQTWNTRHNKFVIFNNETKCVQEWAEIYKIDSSVLAQRLRSGWTMEEAINSPIDISLNNTENSYTFNDKTQSLRNWSSELNISYQTLYRRINYYGWSIEKSLSTPKLK